MTVSAKNIVDFWFDNSVKKLWFNSTDAFDEKLRVMFEPTYLAGADGLLTAWKTSPEGALALVILLDQFPLNMYRGDKKSFETEALSREVANEAISHEFDQQLPLPQRAFLYLPFMHSENPEDQQTGVDLFESAGLDENLRFAKHHQDLIRRFGRFPHRNKILERKNTPEEVLYLNSEEAFLG